MAPNDTAPITPAEAEGLRKVADAFGVKIVDESTGAQVAPPPRRPFTPKFPPPLPVTPYDLECAIAKAPTEEFLIAVLGSAVAMKNVAPGTKKRWANVAEKRVAELKANPPQFVRLSPSDVFPEVQDDRPAMSHDEVACAVNGNREWFCAENGIFTFDLPDGRRVGIHDYFKIESPCKECGGQGYYAKYPANGDPPEQEPCPRCGGDGYAIAEDVPSDWPGYNTGDPMACPDCDGSGKKREDRL